MAEITKRLKEDYDYLVNQGYEVVGVFLQGSQNYELDYENSDIDTKAIVIPSMRDIILNKQPKSTTHIKEDNSHIDIKDIRLMFDCFKKQNINFLEILFTKYRYINPEYIQAFNPMLENAEKIAHYNNYKAVQCIAGMMFEKQKALCHRYEGLKDKIDKYGYDSKQLHHIVRCREFLTRYINNELYADCLISKNKEELIEIKRNNVYYSKEEAVMLADRLCNEAKEIYRSYIETTPIEIDIEVEELMDNVLSDVFSIKFKKDLAEH